MTVNTTATVIEFIEVLFENIELPYYKNFIKASNCYFI